MSVESREDFVGLVQNASTRVAPPGSLSEAENIVIRRPGVVEPRDGLAPAPAAPGTGPQVWGFSYGTRDIVARTALPDPALYYWDGAHELGALTPLRRDILSKAELRGNLYVAEGSGVSRLLPDEIAFTRAGVPTHVAITSAFATPQGAPPLKEVYGSTAFPPPSDGVLQSAAGAGQPATGDFWVAVLFTLDSLPAGPEQGFLARSHGGVYPAANGYQLDMIGGSYRFYTVIGGTINIVNIPILPEHVGRSHVLMGVVRSGVMTLYLDGAPSASAPSGAVPNDPAARLVFGSLRIFSGIPGTMISATLAEIASGATSVDAAAALAFYNATVAADALSATGATRKWALSSAPPIVVLGSDQMTMTTGAYPLVHEVTLLWPGDPLPADYPPEFWLPIGFHVAYRLVEVTNDPDKGLERRSAPSSVAVAVNNGPGAGASVTLTILISPSIVATTPPPEIEIYRSRAFPTDVILDDEMQLVARIPIAAEVVTAEGAGVMHYVDALPEDERGATLYTSPSRGGALEQNGLPPACACIAAFKSSLFFGNTRGPATLIVSFTWVNDLTGQAKGVGIRVYSGTSVLGNAVLTVSSTVGLEPGQIVSGPGSPSALPLLYIVSVGAGSVTLSAPAGAGAGAGNFTFEDALWLGATPLLPRSLYLADAWFPAEIGATQIIPPLDGHSATWVFTSDTQIAVAAPYTVRATHGGEYTPPLPLYSEPAELWPQDVRPGGLSWSKPDEPEHVTPVAFAFVGDQNRALLGLVPTRDALFILKEDGVWRLTGANATWRIDPYDPTLFCALPMSVQPLQEKAYFLSNKGVVSFADSGSEIVSHPVNDTIKAAIDVVLANWRATGLYEVPGVIGCVAGVYERENEYTLLVKRAAPLLVFNRNTSAWTTWTYPAATGEAGQTQNVFSLPHAGRVVYALSDGASLYANKWTWLSTDVPLATVPGLSPRFNHQIALTVSAVLPTTPVDLRRRLLGVPGTGTALAVLVDDVMVDPAGRMYRVTSTTTVPPVGSGAIFIEQEPGSPEPLPGAWVFHRSIRCRMAPLPWSSPPPRPKRWRGLSCAFEALHGPVALRYAYASSQNPRAPDAWDLEDCDFAHQATQYGALQYPMGYAYTGLVPSAHARAWSLRTGVRWAMSHGVARLEGLHIDAEAVEIGRQQKA